MGDEKKDSNGWKPGNTPTWGEIYGKVSKVDGINVGPLPQDTRENDAMKKTVDKANNWKTVLENLEKEGKLDFNTISPPIPKDASEEHYKSINKIFKNK